jgi:hypothetical protein
VSGLACIIGRLSRVRLGDKGADSGEWVAGVVRAAARKRRSGRSGLQIGKIKGREKWAAEDLAHGRYRIGNLFNFPKPFIVWKLILNSIQIQILNDSSHKIKSNSTHQYKIKYRCHENATNKYIKPKLI